MNQNIPDLEIKREKFSFVLDPSEWKPSDFDEGLRKSWDEKMKDGIFRYQLNVEDEKTIGEKNRFFLQLNPLRSEKRRRPESIQSLRQPFNPEKFNFTKIKSQEFLFQTRNEDGLHFIAINDSPFDRSHSLLIPNLYESKPQILSCSALKIALHVILASSSPFIRIGFNGLCAFASINHLHFHIYYLEKHMTLETVPVQHLSGNCYYQEIFPSKGYVFQVKTLDDIEPIIKDVIKLSDYFNDNNIAHNLYITRGSSFESTNSKLYDALRIYIWCRTPSFGWKDVNVENPALCELFGHFLLKSRGNFEDASEEKLTNLLTSLTEIFESTKPDVKKIFKSE